MKKAILVFTLLTVIFTTGCQKFDDNNEIPGTTGMENLIISKDFNWRTTTTIDVNIRMLNNEKDKPVRIVAADRSRVFYQGYGSGNSGVINTRITIPTWVKELEIQPQMGSVNQPVVVPVNGSVLTYDFNNQAKSAYMLSSFKATTELDFNTDGMGNPLPKGTILSDQWSNLGISLSADNKDNNGPDEVIIFDSSDPYSGDLDLGTPNEDFGGPGKGSGGAAGQLGENNKALGNLIIIPENITDNNGDGLVDEPNDESKGGKIYIEFDNAVDIETMEFVDMDDGSLSSRVICEQDDGTEVEFTIPYLGENSYKELSVFLDDVVKVTVQFKGSGSVASLSYSTEPVVDNILGNLSYEDLWPGKGDYDFNDVVIDYEFEIEKNTQDEIEKITATFITRAYGASFHNGFGFTFPNVAPDQIISVSGYDIQPGSIFNLLANGTEAGQSKATIIVFDDTYNIMPHPGGAIGVNTETAAPYVTPDTIVMEIAFINNGTPAPGGTVSYAELDIGNFNPFIVVDQIREMEVHLPDYPSTDLASSSYFGTQHDDSDPGTGRYYKTDKNLPWAIHIPESFIYPIEKQDITGAHLKFAQWAESGGVDYPDWYQDKSGYRNTGKLY